MEGQHVYFLFPSFNSMPSYSERAVSDLSKYLVRLRDLINEDLEGLPGYVGTLTLEEVDLLDSRLDRLYAAYRQAVPFSRSRPRNGPSSERTDARSRPALGARSGIEQAALEAIERQGYVTESFLVTTYGLNKNAVHRRLQALAPKYGWDYERQQGGDWAYAHKVESQPEDQTDVPMVPTTAEATGQRRRQRHPESTEPPETEPGPSETVPPPQANGGDAEPSAAT